MNCQCERYHSYHFPKEISEGTTIHICSEHKLILRTDCPNMCCSNLKIISKLAKCSCCSVYEAEVNLTQTNPNLCCQCFKKNTQKSLTNNNIYINNMGINSIEKIISQIAPFCQNCQCRKTRVCLEKMCSNSKFICSNCDKILHLTHRTNEIRLFCIDKNVLKSYQSEVNITLSLLKNIIETHRERCVAIVNEFTEMAELFTANLIEVESVIKKTQQNWELFLSQCIEKYESKQLNPTQARKIFQQNLININIWNDYLPELKSFDKTQSYLIKFDKSVYRSSQANYGNNTMKTIRSYLNLTERKCKEKLIRQNPIQCFANIQFKEKLDLLATNFTDGANSTDIVSFMSGKILSNRVIINKIGKSNLQYYKYLQQAKSLSLLRPRLIELHAPFYPNPFPQKQLTSLTLDLSGYTHSIAEFKIQQIPKSVETLRMLLTSFIKTDLQTLKSLSNLKYLVVSQQNFQNSQKKTLLQIAIEKNLRMTCLVKKNNRQRRIKDQIGDWQYRFQAAQQHEEENLKRHYQIYRRKLHQISKIQRSGLRKLPLIFKPYLLQMTASESETNIEKQFDDL